VATMTEQELFTNNLRLSREIALARCGAG